MTTPDPIVYVRVWCMGRCARYSTPRAEPKRCPKCGGEVLCVPIHRSTLEREGKR